MRFAMKFLNIKFSGWPVLFLAAALARPALPAQKLDTTQFIVVGEGLAAGMADFQLRDVNQTTSFPAVMANVFNTAFPMPTLESAGLPGGAPGFTPLPPIAPGNQQGSLRDDFPPNLFVFNLSVPGFKVSDSLNVPPAAPLVQGHNGQQTLVNFILGYPALIAGSNLPLWSQTQYAVEMNPTLVIVELGYYDVLEAATTDNPADLPNIATLTSNYTQILSRINAGSYPQIIVTTVPNPFDTAYFTPVANVTGLLGASPATVESLFGVGPNDYLTPNGLMVAGSQIKLNVTNPPPLSNTPYAVVHAATATAVEASVTAVNAAIKSAAQQIGSNVIVYDLNAFFSSVRQNGLVAGSTTLSANYLGGFYSLDGYYPGQTGQAAIANNLLNLLNSTYGTTFLPVNLGTVASTDPVLGFTPTLRKKGTAR
jgi:hypothetical protein